MDNIQQNQPIMPNIKNKPLREVEDKYNIE